MTHANQPLMKKNFFSAGRLYFLAFVLVAFFSSLVVNAQVHSYQLNTMWSIAPQFPYDWVSTNNTQRGLAYNAATTHLLSVSRYPATNAAVYILNSETGDLLGNLSTNGIFPDINFPLNLVGVADDGVVYACNLTVDSTNTALGNNGPFRIYRWANESAEPALAYLGDPSNADTNVNHRRFGDSFAVRGFGTNTEMIVGTRAGKIAAHFTTIDGTNFTHQKLDAPQLVGAVAMATISFGASNTFFVKTESNVNTNYPLQQFSYDAVAGTAALLKNYTNASLVGGSLMFDPSRNLMAVIRTVSHHLRLFKLTESGFFLQETNKPFPSANANGNFTGAIVITTNRLFALESNNGLLAFQITRSELLPFTASLAINSPTVTLTWNGYFDFVFQAQYKNSLSDPAWINLSDPIGGVNDIMSTTDTLTNGTRFYRVRAE